MSDHVISMMKPLGLLTLFSILVGTAHAQVLTLNLNQTTFRPQDTLRVGLHVGNPGPGFNADFYFGYLLPDGVTAVFLTSLLPLNSVKVRIDGNPQAFKPLVANVLIPQGLNISPNDVFVSTFSGSDPPGAYVFFAALTLPGAFADGQVQAGDILAIDSKAFTVQALTATIRGLDFSPYLDGQNPNINPNVSLSQIQARMQIIAPYTRIVRSFSSTNGLENIPGVARSFHLQVAAGAWISTNANQNAAEIASLISLTQAGLVDIAIVGSEALLRGDVTEQQLISYITQVRQAIPSTIPVGTTETFDVLLAHPQVIAASTAVLANIYPYWQGVSANNALCSLITSYQQVIAASGGRPVYIAETGWPTAGNAIGAAIPSLANATQYFLQFTSWAKVNNVPYFYFEAFDEAWKATPALPQEGHWGIWDSSGQLKPGMQPVFDGQTVTVSCNGIPGGPGTPSISFTYVPPIGKDGLEGEVLHVLPSNYKVAVYIKVGREGWWTKPFFSQPLTLIQADGTWSTGIVTGGQDQLATEIAAFLVPNGYSPPALGGAPSLPSALYTNSVANTQVTRSQK